MSSRNIDSDELKQDLNAVLGQEMGESIYQSIRTSSDRLRYANIRLCDIETVIHEKISPHFEKWRDSFFISDAEDDFHQSQFDIRMLGTEAVQHLHSVFDPVACAVYWFTVPTSEQKMMPRDLTFYKVRTCAEVDSRYKKILSAMASTESFFHVAALSNLAKHSRIVTPSFRQMFNGEPPPDAESAMVFKSCQGANPLNVDLVPPELHEFSSISISVFLRNELQRVAPLFNELVGLMRSELDMRLQVKK